jgi:single-stranded-DNA-specific exonuclease
MLAYTLNHQRKKIVATIMRDVHKKLITRKQIQDLPEILVIGDPTWPAGILGLVASKIIEEYSCTTFVWGSEGDAIKGSCRGVGDVSVVKLMQGIAHLLVQFGGHEEAGGFTTTREHVHFLEEAFNTIYQETKHDVSKQIHEIVFDSELELADVTMAHYRALRQMAPFGMGNPKPVFAFKNIPIEQVNQFGKTKEHLELVLSPKVRAISWYARPDSFTAPIEVGKNMTILAEFDHSVFRGKEELRLMIVDVLE